MEEKDIGSEEFAEGEFERWAEENDIDLAANGTSEENTLFKSSKHKVIRAIQRGRLALNDNVDFEYTTSAKNKENYANVKILCKRPDTRSIMRQRKQGAGGVDSGLEVISSMTEKDTGYIMNLIMPDVNTLAAIAYFFTAA